LLSLLPLPLAFALLFVGWPTVFRGPAPWWVIVGLVFYDRLFSWAIGVQLRACGPTL